jgi:hypothetical protein
LGQKIREQDARLIIELAPASDTGKVLNGDFVQVIAPEPFSTHFFVSPKKPFQNDLVNISDPTEIPFNDCSKEHSEFPLGSWT